MKVAVIGAGPSGLVTLKYLKQAHQSLGTQPIDARIFEAEAGVGGTFLARTYEDAELVSSKQLTSFSDFRPRDDDEDFVSAPRYIEYLNEYCTHFDLWPNIQLRTKVLSVARGQQGGHVITYQHEGSEEQLEWQCDAIAVCAGLHLTPSIPHFEGIERVPKVFHSSEFKSRSQFGVDKTVLIIGSGETGADLGYLAVTSPTKRVVICHRNGCHFAPKRNLNPAILPSLGGKPYSKPTVPIDSTRGALFDTAYVHPILRHHDFLLWQFYDIYVKSALWFTSGARAGYDQYVGEATNHHLSKIFLNKSSKVTHYISNPYREQNKTLAQRLRSFFVQTRIPDTHGRHVDLAPLPECFDENGVVRFVDNGRPEYQRMKDEKVKPDIVVFCTGYRQVFPFLTAKANEGMTAGRPYPTAFDADVRNIWKRDDPSVAFIGYIRPALGAIPPLSEMQAQLWVLSLVAPSRIPRPLTPMDEPHYRLNHPKRARIQYGVDQDSYVYQLALDMDSALSFTEVLKMGIKRSWKWPLVWALTANVNPKFRVRGPWKWAGAEKVMLVEMWREVRRRRWFFDHFLLSFLPMGIFGPLSLACYIYDSLVSLVFPKRRSVQLEV